MPEPAPPETDLPVPGAVIAMTTTLGEIRIELYPNEAPLSAANFLQYVEDGFYDGTIFHRVVRGFVIQGGGFTADMTEKETRAPIQNEAQNGLRNGRGWLSMARTMDPHSATSQFFINTVDNATLDHKSPTPGGWGYAVFGRVVEGLDVVDAIEASPVVSRAGFNDVPQDPIAITSATVQSPRSLPLAHREQHFGRARGALEGIRSVPRLALHRKAQDVQRRMELPPGERR